MGNKNNQGEAENHIGISEEETAAIIDIAERINHVKILYASKHDNLMLITPFIEHLITEADVYLSALKNIKGQAKKIGMKKEFQALLISLKRMKEIIRLLEEWKNEATHQFFSKRISHFSANETIH